MTDPCHTDVEFDEFVGHALAESVYGPAPRPEVRSLLMARVTQAESAERGFSFQFAGDDTWRAHPVPGIQMKVLATNARSGYATLLLDVAPGVRFPAHHHGGDEQCFVLSGSMHTLGRRLGPGDFLHAMAGTDHTELWTDEGARVILIVPEDEVPA
jgi:quercetin dioxygenase-like cupin family protein